MAKSEAFERNAEKVIDVVDAVPPGRLVTYGGIGRAIGIVPRYVALIMASAPEVSTTNWHRVVGADGTVKPGAHRSEQIRRLRKEGVQFDDSRIVNFAQIQIEP